MTGHGGLDVLEINLLGPPEFVLGGRSLRLADRHGLVLTLLALDTGRVVPVPRLIEEVWEGDPPATARGQISMLVSALRRDCGGPEVIETAGGGYRLRGSAVRVDADRARSLIDRALRTGAEDLYAEAVGLWRGLALSGLTGPMIEAARQRLEELRLTTLERWAACAATGDQRLVDHLFDAVRCHPLHEGARACLMEVLWRKGRRTEALQAYHLGRQALADELGVEPGKRLRDLHDTIARGEPEDAVPAEPAPAVPAQLPPAMSAFTNRHAELDSLDDLVAASGVHLPVAVISGIGGVGKSALAVHWAHRAAAAFPHGQLFADLHGHDDSAEAANPYEVMEGFLRALGVPEARIPADSRERVNLYRSTLQDRKVLIILDDAATTAQVRPLLPGSRHCCVLVTARHRLEGLIAAQNAKAVPLDTLDENQSQNLLAEFVGAERAKGDRESLARLAELCAGLPLALSIAAAHLVSRPRMSVADFTVRLGDERRRLDALSGGEPDVRGSFAFSYRALPGEAADAFRRLGLLESPAGIAPWLAAAVLDETDLRAAEQVLEILVDAQLLQPLGHDAAGQSRYRFHDLVRLFARERAEIEEDSASCEATLRRAFGAALGLAEEAVRQFRGEDAGVVRGRATRWLPERNTAPPPNPLDWLEAERLTISAAVHQSARAGMAEFSWELAVTSALLHQKRGYLEDRRSKYETALRACRAAGDSRGQAAVLLSSADHHLMRGEIGEAARQAEEAAGLFREAGDLHAWALALTDSAVARRSMGDWEQAERAFQQAVEFFASSENPEALAYTLHHLGFLYLERDRPAEAEEAIRKAIAALPGGASELRDLLQRALGEVGLALGRHHEALEIFDRLLAGARDKGDVIQTVRAMLGAGSARLGLGDAETGMPMLEEALELTRSLRIAGLEARVMLAMGHHPHPQQVERLEAAAVIFKQQGGMGWHAKAIALLKEARRRSGG